MGYDWSHSPQPFMSDSGSTMSGLAGEFVGLAIDDARNSYWNKRQQEQYRENMQQQFDMSQQAQRMAARNQVAGLEAAGLSPVLAHSAAGAPVGSSQMPTMPSLSRFSPLEIVQMRNLEAQTDQLEAQSRKTEEETESIKLANENTISYNETLAVNLPNLFEELSKDGRFDKKLRSSFAATAKEIREEGTNEGAARGIEKYLDLRFEQKQQMTKELQNEFDWQVVYEKYDDPSVVSAVAKLPKAQKHNLESLSMQYMAQVGMLAQTSETEVAKREKIVSEIQKIDREAQAILHSDPAQMDKEHNSQGLMWFIGSSMMGSLDRKADAVIKGAMKSK